MRHTLARPALERGLGSLEGTRLKLARGRRHIEDLREALEVHFQPEPYRVIRREDEHGDLVYSVQVVNELPTELGAIVGDAIHNTRSALDLLCWQLVTAGGGRPDRNTSFPMPQSERGFDGVAQRCLAGASSRTVRFIKRLKPWPGGNETLFQLHQLDIADKHRLILVVGTAHRNIVLNLQMQVPWQEEPVRFPPLALKPADRQFPLADGTEMYRVKAAARSGLADGEPQFTFEPCFGEEGDVRGLPILSTLERIHDHVSRIVQIADRQLL